MTKYNIRYKDDHLAHAGKKGMKWGFNDGEKNGKRTADPEWKMYKEIDDTLEKYPNDWYIAEKYGPHSYRVPTSKTRNETKYKIVSSDKVYTKFDQAVDKKNAKAKKEAAYAIKRAKRRTNAERVANKAVDLYEDAENKFNKTKKSAKKIVSNKAKQAKKWLNKNFK